MAKVIGCDLSKIGRFGKILDFYYWKGILCVRKYPKKARQPGTLSQRNTWSALRYANEEFNRLVPQERDAFKFLANPSQMSGRDLFLKTILEEYQSLGANLCQIRIRTEAEGDNNVRVIVTKTANAPVLLAGLTPEDKRKYLTWEEISPTLRGKKFMRRWDLADHTEEATFVKLIPENYLVYNTVFSRSSGIRYLTARAVNQPGGGFGRAGLYEVA